MEFLEFEPNKIISDVEVYCAGVYSKNLQKLIRGVKYHNQKDLAYYQAKFMYGYWQNVQDKDSFYQVVPVPLFKLREKKRKYNHMQLVGEEFCKLSGYELNSELIVRIKDTKPQYNLNKNQRMENLSKAFKINKNFYSKGKILLFDDICTTGSTFENMISEFRKEGIKDIVCFATTTPFLN
jgi:ComF family protein